MENKIRISVLMAVYNTDFFLVKRAIDSVLNQDFQDFELIVIDDGSHNNSQNDLLSYIKKHEHKIVYLHHQNCGQSKSINRGILNSKGAYITIIDADDEYKPNHLMSCLREMKYNDLIASTTKTIVDTEDDYYVPDKYDIKQVIHVDNCILFATLFGKREVFTTLKFQDMYAADAHFYEAAAKKYIVNKIDLRTYIYYRNIPNSTCAKMKKANLLTSV
ncbi:MAG: glycosyltransferase family 2 protein [Cytophagales bacterium]|nr:MAG: glycosyltransferase family 2 protein [Cytophagales bacterium]